MKSESIDQSAEPDFARIVREASPPSLAERLGGRALAWMGALAAIALVALGALWLRDERSTNLAMQLVALNARGDAAAPAAAAGPTASSLPPLVMLPQEQAAKPAPAALVKADTAARLAVASKPAPVVRAGARTAPRAVKRKPAETRVASRSAKPRAPAVVVVNREPVNSGSLNIAVAQRCKTGDLARECLASLCRDGKKGDAACQALSNLDH